MSASIRAEWPRKVRRKVRVFTTGLALRAKGKKPLHLLHIYKTGGTALKHALADAPSASSYVLIAHKHSISLDCVPRGQDVAFFVRDPIERFISGFYDRHREGKPRYYTPWSPAEAETFAHFATPNDIAEALAGDPAEVASAERALASLDRMTQPLSDWLGTPEYFLSRRDDVLFVGRQETLSTDFENLKRLLGLPEDLSLPSGQVEAHRASGVDRHLSERGREALAAWFAADYDFLKLCQDHALFGAKLTGKASKA